MPLLDHFTEPVDLRNKWESFHSYWAVAIGKELNERLPKRFHASVQQHHGSRIEADVLEYDRGYGPGANGSAGGTAVQTYAPPRATGVLQTVYPDEVEVPIFDSQDGDRLVAVIELVSPSNKHDPGSRRTFAGKCAAFLANGIGLVVVDPVHISHFNLHDELIDLVKHPIDAHMPSETWSYASAYRPTRRESTNQIDYWTARLAVGEPLPTMPLALKGWGPVPLELESSYLEACRFNGLI